MAEDKKETKLDSLLNSMTEEERQSLMMNMLKEEEEEAAKEAAYEKKANIVKTICAVIGIGAGIKYYFLSGEYEFFVALISTGILTGILEFIGIALLSVFVKPEDL